MDLIIYSISFFVLHSSNGIHLDLSRESKILKNDFVNDGSGNYFFEYLTSDGQSREEKGKLINQESVRPQLVVEGSYSFTALDGKTYTVTYTADKDGFHPKGDHIKVPPYIPWPTNLQLTEEDGQYRTEDDKSPVNKVYLPSTERTAINFIPLLPEADRNDKVIVPTPRPSVANTYIPSTPSATITREYVGATPRSVRKHIGAESRAIPKVAINNIKSALFEVIENNHSKSGVFSQ